MSTKSIYKRIGIILKEKKLKLSIAESCTGGFIAKSITDIAGSSKYFICGIVSYSNESKIKLLGVRKETLKKYGAVSEQTAREMVQGIKRTSKADIAIATTGIAGPTGGTKNKPVGTVYIAIKYKNKIKIFHFIFSGNRNSIRKKTVKKVGKLLLEIIQ